MLIPLGTDAPIYYRPYGTIGIILLNCAIFGATISNPELIETYGLLHGRGFQPVQWITSNFIHGNLLHLVGNMIFLWGFGLVVEGKLGWQRFVPLFLLIGATECAIEQVLLRDSGVLAFGASAVIFGLMAISLIWAPRNEVTVGYWILFRPGVFDISIVWFAALLFLKSALIVMLLHITSELLHLLGAGVGAALGLLMLRYQMVDCEGWDLFSVMSGNTPASRGTGLSHAYQADMSRRKNRKVAKRKSRDAIPVVTDAKPQPERFTELIRKNKPHAALAELRKLRHLQGDWQPELPEALELARQLRRLKEWRDSVEIYEEYVERDSQNSLARLELSELLVLVQERPTAAQRVLAECDVSGFTPQQKERFDAVQRHAQKMIDSGIIELQGGSW